MNLPPVMASALSLTLAACSTLPSPTEALAPGNAQVRLTEADGALEGGYQPFLGGAVNGKSCVLSVLGELAPGVTAALTQGGCSATVGQ